MVLKPVKTYFQKGTCTLAATEADPPLILAPFPTGACCKISCSNFAGEGMKPISQPSLTMRPIHQLTSYFSKMCRKSPMLNETAEPWTGESSSRVPSYMTFVLTAKATGLVRARLRYWSACSKKAKTRPVKTSFEIVASYMLIIIIFTYKLTNSLPLNSGAYRLWYLINST